MANAVRIIVEEDGYPRELLSPVDWKRAFADGSLEAETEVTVYRDGAAPEYARALDVAELQPLFRPAPPPPRQRETPAAVPPPPAFIPPPAAPAPDAEAADMDEERRPSPWATLGGLPPGGGGELHEEELHYGDEDYRDAPAWQPEPGTGRRSRAPLLLVLAGVAALFLVFWIANAGPPGAAAPATVYSVTGTANVRTLPSAGDSQVVGRLRRGDVVVGVPRSSAGGETWVEISEGPNAGRYVWGRNLAPAAAP